MSFEFYWDKEGLHIRFFGVVNFEDIINAMNEQVGDQRFESIKYIIWDTNNVKAFDMNEYSVEETVMFAKLTFEYNKHVRIAFLVNNLQNQKLIESFIEHTLKSVPHARQRVFDKIDTALKWLAS